MKKAPDFLRNQVLLGGDKRDRTADLLNAIQALSQLSYTPVFCSSSLRAEALSLGTSVIIPDGGRFVNTFLRFFQKSFSAALGEVIHGLFQGPSGAAQGAADFLFMALQAHADGGTGRHAEGDPGAEGMVAAHRAVPPFRGFVWFRRL